MYQISDENIVAFRRTLRHIIGKPIPVIGIEGLVGRNLDLIHEMAVKKLSWNELIGAFADFGIQCDKEVLEVYIHNCFDDMNGLTVPAPEKSLVDIREISEKVDLSNLFNSISGNNSLSNNMDLFGKLYGGKK